MRIIWNKANCLLYVLQHKRFVSDAREKEPEVVFIGDSNISYLSYLDMWLSHFVPMHSLNFGINSERVENTLWRVQNGEMDFMSPKVISFTGIINSSIVIIVSSDIFIFRRLLLYKLEPTIMAALPNKLPMESLIWWIRYVIGNLMHIF